MGNGRFLLMYDNYVDGGLWDEIFLLIYDNYNC